MGRNRLLIIGLDAGTWDIIRPWVDEGLLPGFSMFLQDGAHARMRSTFPPITPPGWASLLTGIDCARRGILGFKHRERAGERWRHLDARTARAWTFLDHMARHGLKVGCINVPMTYPARQLPGGLMISSQLNLGAMGYRAPGAFAPDSTAALLERSGLLGGPQRTLDDLLGLLAAPADGRRREAWYARWSIAILEDLYRRRGLLRDVLAHSDLDLLMFQLQDTDLVLHLCTRLRHAWQDEPGHDRQVKRQVYNVYRAVDDLLCELLAVHGDSWSFALVSDHGAAALDLDRGEYDRVFRACGAGALAPLAVPTERSMTLDDTVCYLARSARVEGASQTAAADHLRFRVAVHEGLGSRRGLLGGVPGSISFPLADVELPAGPLELSFGFHWDLARPAGRALPDATILLRASLDGATLLERRFRVRDEHDARLMWPCAAALPEGARPRLLELSISCDDAVLSAETMVFVEAPRLRRTDLRADAAPAHVYRFSDSEGAEVNYLNDVGMAALRVRGRERAGAVPTEQKDARAQLLKERLQALRHRDGTPLLDRVATARELVTGIAFGESDVDVCFTYAPGHHLPIHEALADDRYHVFTHHPDGMLGLLGPGFVRGAALPPVDIVDFAPTVLHFFGLPVPDTLEGRVLQEAFTDRRAVTSETPPPWVEANDGPELSREEQEAVEQRLRDLGYL